VAIGGAQVIDRGRSAAHQQQTVPADPRLIERLLWQRVRTGAWIEWDTVVFEGQHERLARRFQRNTHHELVSIGSAVGNDVGSDLFEYQLGVIARRPFDCLRIESPASLYEAAGEARVSAGEADLDAPAVPGAIRLRATRGQPRTVAAAALASERTGTMSFNEVVCKTSATSGCAPYSTNLPPFLPRARAMVMNMRIPPDPMKVTCDRSMMARAPRGTS